MILHDNWQVSGLCGTGSGDFEFDDVFVPDRFVHPQQPEPTQPGTLYRLPTGSIYPWTVAVVPVGLARGALREFLAIAGKRKRRNDTLPLAERELVQSEVGRIEARLWRLAGLSAPGDELICWRPSKPARIWCARACGSGWPARSPAKGRFGRSGC